MGSVKNMCTKRLLSDWMALQREPLIGAAAAPVGREDCTDMTLWDACIEIDMPTDKEPEKRVPLYFVIEFPDEYPSKAPSIGFQYSFPYRNGATMTVGSGRLRGKMAICLDILANFDHYHTEWKGQVGTGWSPAYSVSTLLLNLQSLVAGLHNDGLSSGERAQLERDAAAFVKKNPSCLLDVPRAGAGRAEAEVEVDAAVLELCGGDAAVAADVMKAVGWGREGWDRVQAVTALWKLARAHDAGVACPALEAGRKVDENIRCYNLGVGYTDDVLGVLARWEGNKIVSPCEMLCAEAWEGGARQSTTKEEFAHYLPVWINDVHAGTKQWRALLRERVIALAAAAPRREGPPPSFAEAVLEVFPRMLNGLLVDLFDENVGKAAAIAYFEGFVNFWRAFRAVLEDEAGVRRTLVARLAAFVADEGARHKDKMPDIGMVLAMFIAACGLPGVPSDAAFAAAYVDEAFLRGVMWWRRDGVDVKDPAAVFKATEIGRCLLMFQLLAKDMLVTGGEGGVAAATAAMDATNCRLPDRLEALLGAWKEVRERVNGAGGGWKEYFQQVKVGKPPYASSGAWLASVARRAEERGARYTGKGGKGKGKGKGGGKGYRGH